MPQTPKKAMIVFSKRFTSRVTPKIIPVEIQTKGLFTGYEKKRPRVFITTL